jgi:AraC-like DNA-binding protein
VKKPIASEMENEGVVAFEYQQSGYTEWLKHFACAAGYKVKDNAISNIGATGAGFSRALEIEDGFSCSIQNYQLDRDKIFLRTPADEFAIIIYLYQFDISNAMQYSFNGTETIFEKGSYNTLRIVNAQTMQQLRLNKHSSLKGISIFLENRWIEKNTGGQAEMLNYLRAGKQIRGFMQAKQQKLVNEIVDMPACHPYPNVYTKSRVYRVLDMLFENFAKGEYDVQQDKIGEKDAEMLQKVEKALVENFMKPFPSIERLSKTALMSESKLKKLFKQAYGMGMHEYFQKNRLHKARELIVAEKRSISEVGLMLGYQNLSNFSVAFKKEFNYLPSEIEKFF